MPRRKQDCPKRMKWEGGEGGEEESPDADKLEGDDDSVGGSATPTSNAMSPARMEDGDTEACEPMVSEPQEHAPISPRSPVSLVASAAPLAAEDDNEQAASTTSSLNQNNLVERDVTSPRCQSRESTESSVPVRCPSRDSLYSDRSSIVNPLRGVTLPASALSPVGVALPATLPPAAAAALLPPNSAAMAAYLGAAAVAAQHSHRLMMTSPLPPTFPRGSVSPLVSSSSSPTGIPLIASRALTSPSSLPLQSPVGVTDGAILDFSTKHKNIETTENDSDVMNLSKPPTPSPAESQLNSPLDLSTSRKRIANESPQPPPARKTSRSSDYKPAVSPWTSPVASHLPYFAAAVAAASNLSPIPPKTGAGHPPADSQLWNGKLKQTTPTPNDATKALEKMSELSKLGGEDLFRSMANSGVSPGNSAGNRHSAWQSHWLNKGAEQAKDVLKCVWCKQSFPSLAAMTTHMKEAKHCGVNVPVPTMQGPTLPPPQPNISSSPSVSSNSSIPVSSPSTNSNKPSQADLNLLIKETMPLPRKLVRGQDVWLGKGAEQTRQILKCMWCGQSFRSLAEMTSHMQQTQHYTNIISQEQIISWKSSDDTKGGGGGGGGSGPTSGGSGGASSHVSAVLTCKVCDQAFSSLKELSNHMVKNSHYKEHIMRSITESGGRRRQTREKRKKSLPVRKLLELERAQHEFKNGDGGTAGIKPNREQGAGRITCEKCGDKIETSQFVDHIRQCVGGGSIGSNQRNFLKSALMSNNIIPPENSMVVGHVTPVNREGRKSVTDDATSPGSRHHRSPSSVTDLSTHKDPVVSPPEGGGNVSSPSVLNAIEKLIEKSFDSRARQSAAGFAGTPGVPAAAPMGSSILKRLGIDESVDYTKPLVDAQTMNILRNYHNHQQNQHHYNRRERSGSESSSMSERGSSRIDALTPDRKMDPPGQPITPRTTPDKRVQTPLSDKVSHEEPTDGVTIKKELPDDDERSHHLENHRSYDAVVKKENIDEGEDEEDKASYHSGSGIIPPRMSTDSRVDDIPEDDVGSIAVKRSNSSAGVPSPNTSPRQPTPALETAVPSSPCRNSTSSPASSDRSGTPRSTAGSDKKTGGSLGALSSMFDNLSGGGGASASDGNSSTGGRRTSSHPLAALQKLCDKTETHHGSSSRSGQTVNAGSSGSTSSSTATATQSTTGTTPGAILAFSWACNDAVMTSDSIMKCAFCDTPFISKGAYRHHLSKMHFVKDGVIPDPVSLKSHQSVPSSSSSSGSSNKVPSGSASSGTGVGSVTPVGPSSKSPQPQAGFEESPHSKFLKYTELAKQLSSKYV